MSCATNNKDSTKRPNRTQKMKDSNQVYVWKTLLDNPNMFCWLPSSMKNVEPGDINLKDAIFQDVPIVPEIKDNEFVLANMIENAKKVNEKILRKKIKDGVDVVSSDDPKKYKLVKQFLSTQNVILYGGAAIYQKNTKFTKELLFLIMMCTRQILGK